MANTTEKFRNGYVTVATVRSRDEARKLENKLTAAKIESLVIEAREPKNRRGKMVPAGEVKVQVDRAQVQAALEVLRSAAGAAEHRSPNRPPKRADLDEMRPVSMGAGGWRKAALEIAALVGAAALLGALVFS